MDEKEKIVLAKDLRKKEIIEEIPKDKPGWYKWWAPEKAFQVLFQKINLLRRQQTN